MMNISGSSDNNLSAAYFGRAPGAERGLRLSDVSIFKATGDCLVKGLSLSVRPGMILGVVGDEGTGKTTLLKALSNELPEGFHKSGRIDIDRSAYLPQILDPVWDPMEIFHFFHSKSPNSEFDPSSWNEYSGVVAACSQLNLDAEALLSGERTVGTLSGGEKTRLQLAKLHFQQCSTLLLDEPTNNLDLSSVAWLEKYLQRHDGAIVVVSHDERFLENVATDILFLQSAKAGHEALFRLNGNGYSEFIEQFDREATKSVQLQREYDERRKSEKIRLNDAQTSADSKARSQKAEGAAEKARQRRGFAKATQQRSAVARGLLDEPRPQAIVLDEPIRLVVPAECAIPAGKSVCSLLIPELSVAGRQLATDVTLSISGPEKVVIVGENGCGKSTLLRTALSLLEESGLRVGYLPQNYRERLGKSDATPLDHLSLISEDEKQIRSLLAALNLFGSDIIRPINSLSGGQVIKVLLAELLLQRAQVLVLDEPTNNLYPLSNRELQRFLREFPGAVLAVSHDRNFVAQVATRVLQFFPGRGLGPPSQETVDTLGMVQV